MKPRYAIPLLACAGAALCAVAAAAEPPVDSSTAAPATHGFVQGMKVGIDPATGRLRPLSAAEIAQLRATLVPAQARGPRAPATEAEAMRTARPLPGGGVAIEVPEDRMSTLVARQRADGSIAITHAHDHTHDDAHAHDHDAHAQEVDHE